MAIIFYLFLVVLSFWGTTYVALHTQWAIFLPLIVMFCFIPLMDEVWKRVTKKRISIKETSSRFSTLPFYVYFILHFLSLALIIYSTKNDELGMIILKAMSSLMFNGGQCVVIGHELCHLPRKIDKLLANFLFSSFMYGHFVLEHVQGHHVYAATSYDPSSSRLGESLWRFLPRTIGGQIKSVFNIEKTNLEKKRWRFSSSFTASIIFALVFLASSYFLGGLNGLYFLLFTHVLLSCF